MNTELNIWPTPRSDFVLPVMHKRKLSVQAASFCRVCDIRLTPVMDFGETTLANDYQDELTDKFKAPLVVCLCPSCSLVQLGHTVSPERLFSNYRYASSQSGSLRSHFQKYARETVDQLGLVKGSRIFGIGGNDGVLEKEYQELGMNVLNIEPSTTVAAMSSAHVPTHCGWFGLKTAEEIARDFDPPDVITCNNCFAHMPDILDVMDGIHLLLKKNGILIIESSYLGSMVETPGMWDQIYHEHVFYWSLHSLTRLLNHYGFSIFRFDLNDQQGGSFRCFAIKDGQKRTVEVLEERLMLGKPETYIKWMRQINEWQHHAKGFLDACKEHGSIACYGAAAKLNMIAHLVGLENYSNWVVDDSPLKHGSHASGSQLQVVPRDMFEASPPDYCLITSANYSQLIRATNPQYKGVWLNPYPLVHAPR